MSTFLCFHRFLSLRLGIREVGRREAISEKVMEEVTEGPRANDLALLVVVTDGESGISRVVGSCTWKALKA